MTSLLLYFMKKILKKLILAIPSLLVYCLKAYGFAVKAIFKRDLVYEILSRLLDENERKTKKVLHKKSTEDVVSLEFFTPNTMCQMRAETFSTKEPEILKWIDEHGGESNFWDIGANIGLYSIYYAKSQPGTVVSFEPSVFNLKQLAKNITINKLSDKIGLVPIPLSDASGYNKFIISSTEEGSAQNAFGVNHGFDGNQIVNNIEYRVMGLSGDKLIEAELIKDIPKLIKIDVDGIEHMILKGMKNVLRAKECYSVFVEVNDEFEEQAEGVKDILEECGFKLSIKTQAEMHELSKYGTTFNQIWFKE